jgi:hypothetical protein
MFVPGSTVVPGIEKGTTSHHTEESNCELLSATQATYWVRQIDTGTMNVH